MQNESANKSPGNARPVDVPKPLLDALAPYTPLSPALSRKGRGG